MSEVCVHVYERTSGKVTRLPKRRYRWKCNRVVWDKTGRYYTRSRREKGRVVREYVGCGVRLLVERVAPCWLQVQAEIRYALDQKEMTFRQAKFHQKRMDASHRRYLAAIKSLALVRKLALPALQINLARKQVNVIAPGIPGTSASDKD